MIINIHIHTQTHTEVLQYVKSIQANSQNHKQM